MTQFGDDGHERRTSPSTCLSSKIRHISHSPIQYVILSIILYRQNSENRGGGGVNPRVVSINLGDAVLFNQWTTPPPPPMNINSCIFTPVGGGHYSLPPWPSVHNAVLYYYMHIIYMHDPSSKQNRVSPYMYIH